MASPAASSSVGPTPASSVSLASRVWSVPRVDRLTDATAIRTLARGAGVAAGVATIGFGQAIGMGWLAPWTGVCGSIGAFTLAGAAVFACWRLDPHAGVARRLVAKALARRQALEAAVAERRDAQLEASVLAEKHEKARVALETQRANVRDALERELSAVASGERRVRERVASRRKEWQTSSRRFANKWTAASRLVDSRYVELVSRHEQKIKARVDARLTELQAEFVERALGEKKLTAAVAPGLGAKLLERLAAAGVASAREVVPERLAAVEGCGQKKAETLLAWRGECEAEARTRAPLFLRPDELAAIRAELSGEMQPIEEAYRRLRTALDERRAEYTAQRKSALDRLANLEWTAGEVAEQESARLRDEHATRFRETAREAIDLAARLRHAYLSARERASVSRKTVSDAKRAYEEAARRTVGRVEAGLFGWMVKTFGWRHASVVPPQRVLRSA